MGDKRRPEVFLSPKPLLVFLCVDNLLISFPLTHLDEYISSGQRALFRFLSLQTGKRGEPLNIPPSSVMKPTKVSLITVYPLLLVS